MARKTKLVERGDGWLSQVERDVLNVQPPRDGGKVLRRHRSGDEDRVSSRTRAAPCEGLRRFLSFAVGLGMGPR